MTTQMATPSASDAQSREYLLHVIAQQAVKIVELETEINPILELGTIKI